MITLVLVAIETSMLCVGRVILIPPGVGVAVGAGVGVGVGDGVAGVGVGVGDGVAGVGVGVGDGVAGVGDGVAVAAGVGVAPVMVIKPLFCAGEDVFSWSSINWKSFGGACQIN